MNAEASMDASALQAQEDGEANRANSVTGRAIWSTQGLT